MYFFNKKKPLKYRNIGFWVSIYQYRYYQNQHGKIGRFSMAGMCHGQNRPVEHGMYTPKVGFDLAESGFSPHNVLLVGRLSV
jgi:hypothetical protein